MPELKIKNRLKRKDSSNNDKIIHDDSPFVNNNNSPFKDEEKDILDEFPASEAVV